MGLTFSYQMDHKAVADHQSEVIRFELRQALFNVAGIFTNRIQRTADIFTDLAESPILDVEGQFHQRSLERQLVLVHSVQQV